MTNKYPPEIRKLQPSILSRNPGVFLPSNLSPEHPEISGALSNKDRLLFTISSNNRKSQPHQANN